MERKQRFKYEMFVRVRDYGKTQSALFPESSMGGQMFARVAAAVAAIDDHLTRRVVAQAEARKVKAATRAAMFTSMKTLALIARRVTRPEPGANPFRMPRRRSLKVEISTALAFIGEAEKRQEQFLRFGLPPTFISDFRMLVDELQQAVDVRLNSKTGRREAQAGIATALAEGLEVIRDLDAYVTVATRDDRVRFAAWQSARHIEGQGSSSSPAKAPAVTVTTPAVPAATRDAEAAVGEAEAPDSHQLLVRAS
jgi:hypothetical protein